MTVFANVRLLDPAQPEPVDVVVAGGRVAAITPAGASTSLDLAQGDAQRIDGEGRVLIPGLWDRHVHVNQWAMARRRFDVSGASSPQHAAAITRDHLDDHKPGQPLLGFGYRPSLWAEPPHKRFLDEAAGSVPVILVATDLHSCWLNSAALVAYGFPESSDGVAREGDCFDLLRRLENVPTEVLDSWVADALKAAAARGVTGVVDMEMAWNPGAWQRRVAAGMRLPVRVEAGFYAQDFDRAVEEGLSSGRPLLPRDDPQAELLTAGPLKVIADGSLNTRTAFCFAPYRAEGARERGVLNMEPDELTALLTRARVAGISAAIHAIGDEANAVVIDAFGASGASGSIEHVQLLQARDVPRLAALGVEASIQPQHAVDDRDVCDEFWADRVHDAYRMRSLLDAGVRLRFGSDAPVAPLDPWVAIGVAVARTDSTRPPWHEEESLTVVEAIAASTESGRAWPTVAESADLVLLDQDPRTVEATSLSAMPVASVVCGGMRNFDRFRT